MKKMLTTAILAMALVASAATATAKGEGKTKLSTEWGFVAGVSYPWMKCDLPEGLKTRFTPRAGLSAGLHMTLKFGNTFALQPEILYTYSTIRILDESASFYTKMNTQTLQVPILLSVRFWKLRINAGPIITLIDNPRYNDLNGEKVMFGRIYPTLTYTAGIGTLIWGHLLIDLRYIGAVKQMSNCLSFNESHSVDIKTSTQSVQLKIGFLF